MDFATHQQLRRFITWVYLSNTLLFWILGSAYLQKILLSDTLFKNSFFDYSSFGGRVFVLLFTIANYLTYMMFLAFIPALFLWCLAYCIPRKRWIFFLCTMFATIALLVLMIDIAIYWMFSFHLNTTIVSLLLDLQMRNPLGLSSYELIAMLVLLGGVILLEYGIAWIVWNQIVLSQRFQIEKKIARIWFASALLCYFTFMTALTKSINIFAQQTPNLPLFSQIMAYVTPLKHAQLKLNQMGEEHFMQRELSNAPMRYPRHPMQCPRSQKPYNVILMMVDTLRFDAVKQAFMPNLTRFGQDNWQFMKHVSGGNSTQPGLFSLFYSIPASYWTAALKQNIAPVFLEMLAQYGYTTSVFWSAPLDNPPFDRTIYAHLKRQSLHDSKQRTVGSRDREVTQQAIDFLSHHPKNSPFFLNLFYDATHSYCTEQDFENVYNPKHEECRRFLLGKEDDGLPLLHRYQNALRFVDLEIEKVLDTIEKQGYLNNSIIMITSDHGEEFDDNHHHYWGHAGNFSAVQTHIPLLIHWPVTSPRRIEYATTSYDVMPTLLKHVFACQNPVSDYSIGQDILLEKGRRPFTLVGSYSNMGLIESDRLTTLYASGDIVVTDPTLEPGQHFKPRIKYLKQAMVLMRMYYAKSNTRAG